MSETKEDEIPHDEDREHSENYWNDYEEAPQDNGAQEE